MPVVSGIGPQQNEAGDAPIDQRFPFFLWVGGSWGLLLRVVGLDSAPGGSGRHRFFFCFFFTEGTGWYLFRGLEPNGKPPFWAWTAFVLV